MPWLWSDSTVRSPSKQSADDPSPTNPFVTTETLLSTTFLTAIILTSLAVYNRHLRRIPNNGAVKFSLRTPYSKGDFSQPAPSIFGKVPAVNDGDNVRLYHTPLLSAIRRIPRNPKTGWKDQTIHIRLAGIDAPELSHFGKPAQPHASESLEYLRQLVRGKKARAWLYRWDQYGRIVGSVYVRRWGIPGLPRWMMRDVGLEMLRAGCATVYEAKFGVEFGGKEKEYRAAQMTAQRKKVGMWKERQGEGGQGRANAVTRAMESMGFLPKRKRVESYESPMEFKKRMKETGDWNPKKHVP